MITTKLLFRWRDKSGRGQGPLNISLEALLDGEDQTSYHGESLYEWAEEAEDGDVWENATDRYEAIELP